MDGSENAGMSSAMVVRINHAETPRFPGLHCLTQGKSAPKVSPSLSEGVADGRAVNIRLHSKYR